VSVKLGEVQFDPICSKFACSIKSAALLHPCCDQKWLRQGGGWSENSHWRENRQLRAEIRASAPDAGKIADVLGMQSGLNSVSMPVGAME
jgi:hypothetical protein